MHAPASGSAPNLDGVELRDRRRIVGGTPTAIQSVPWQVALTYSPQVASGSAFDRQFCGGTLVSPTLVVTAAHCVFDSGSFTPPDLYSVVSGRTVLSSTEGRESAVNTYIYWTDGQGQPLYDPRTNAWDVILMQLSEPAAGTPALLAGQDERELWAPGRAALISGWGTVKSGGQSSDQLLAAEVVVMPNADCSEPYGTVFQPTLSVCAGTALGERDTCQGDSGGPLVVQTATGEPRLAGDTQSGNGCASAYDPGIYGRVAEDPIRAAIQTAATDLTGESIVGSGGVAPSTLTPTQARENAWIYVEADCNHWRLCRSYGVGRCVQLGAAHRCKVNEGAKKRRVGRFRCDRKVLLSAAGGSIVRTGLKRWKCHL